MGLMKEDVGIRQIPGERKRRWFYSDEFDLVVWLNHEGSFAGFELCYDKKHVEHSVVWHPDAGFTHTAVDEGESRPGRYKATPIHIAANGHFDVRRIYSAFKKASHTLPADVVAYVLRALETHPNWSGEAAKDG